MSWREGWAGRRVLVTGHTGFKGAWLALWLQRLGAAVSGIALPAEHERGIFPALAPWADLSELNADIRDRDAVGRAITSARPDVVFHLAAESLVRRSFADPSATFAANVCGTSHVLEAAARNKVGAVVVITSDKVYANSEEGRPFVESDRLGGRDPYSASKACAELVTASWRAMAKATQMATARAGNVIGGGDVAPDRLLPDTERALLAGTRVQVRNPNAVRPWQFVLEPLHGYLLLAELLLRRPHAAPHSLNFGPGADSALTVAQVVDRAVQLSGATGWKQSNEPGPPEATVLRLDASLAETVLGWRSRLDVDTALAWTVEWWRASRAGADLRSLAEDQIRRYELLVGS